MSIITVSGEMGSWRSELAIEICRQGKLECVDRRTLMEAVQGLVEITRDEHQLLAEQGPALLDMGPRRRRMFVAFLESVVLQYASKGGVVLVGRGGNLLLRLVPGVLRVRTVAPLELRAQRVAAKENLDLDRARRLASVVDQQRRSYMAHVFGADWSSPLNYDLVLNTGRLSLELAAATVLDLASNDAYQLTSESISILDDMVLASRVRRELVAALDVHALEVDGQRGRVSLAGYVSSRQEMDSAGRLAQAIDGVETVENHLEVAPALMRSLPG